MGSFVTVEVFTYTGDQDLAAYGESISRAEEHTSPVLVVKDKKNSFVKKKSHFFCEQSSQWHA